MAKLYIAPETSAKEAFQVEVRVKRAQLNMPQSALASYMDIQAPQMSLLLSNPDKLSVGRLRTMVQVLNLDPVVLLALLGYSQKAIASLRKPVEAPDGFRRKVGEK